MAQHLSYKLIIRPDVAKLCPEGKAAPFARIPAMKPLQIQRPISYKDVLVFSSLVLPAHSRYIISYIIKLMLKNRVEV